MATKCLLNWLGGGGCSVANWPLGHGGQSGHLLNLLGGGGY